MTRRTEMERQEFVVTQVRRALSQTKWNCEANDSMVIRKVTPDMTGGSIAQLCEQMGNAGQLLFSEDYAQPFREFYAQFPQYDLTCNEETLVHALVAEGLGLDADNLAYVAGQPRVAERLVVTQSYAQAAREKAHAEALEAWEKQQAEQYRNEMYGWHETLQKSLFAKHRINTFERDRSLRDEKRRLDATDYQALATEYTRRKEVRRAQSMDPKEYRAEVAISRAANHEPVLQPKMTQALASQYETMPMEWVPRGSLTPITLDRKMLIHIANTDRELFRSLVRRFSAQSVDARLNGVG